MHKQIKPSLSHAPKGSTEKPNVFKEWLNLKCLFIVVLHWDACQK